MLVADLQALLETFAPSVLAESWDNVGLLVGDERAAVRRVLAALELTPDVLDEALATGCDTVVTHHPPLFSPVKSLVESRPRERLLRRLVAEHMTLVACHTNLDSAPNGIADIVGTALGLKDMRPLLMAAAGWYKLVGFIPPSSVERVAAAVFAAGGGGIGNYKDCAFATDGTGWFMPLLGSDPTIGEIARPERTPEIRWETVVPRSRLARAVRVFVEAHPYEAPAFDVYPVEDVLPRVGLGRVGRVAPIAVGSLAERVKQIFELDRVSFSGDPARIVERIGVLPGAGRSFVDEAPGLCDALVTGDLSYHMGEQAGERNLSLIDTPHGELEWWAFRKWADTLAGELRSHDVTLSISGAWRSSWTHLASPGTARGEVAPLCPPLEANEPAPAVGGEAVRDAGRLLIWIDGGSRGNPGPSAIGVVIETAAGEVVQTIARTIGICTNNVAEYTALLTGLQVAEQLGASEVDVTSDSELLVKQMRGLYRVKNEGLMPLYEEARRRKARFIKFGIHHVERAHNARADALVNQALDEQLKTGL